MKKIITTLLAALFFAAFIPVAAQADITYDEAYFTAATATYDNAASDFNAAFNPWGVYKCPHAGTCWNYEGNSLYTGAKINNSLWLMAISHFATWSAGSNCEWRVTWNVAVREHADGSTYATDESRREPVTKVLANC